MSPSPTDAADAADNDVLAAYGLAGFPFGWAVAALFVIVFFRAQGTYWVGRAVAAGARRTRRQRLEQSPATARAVALLHRWGPVAVTASFFTVGVQTAVNAAAGLVRMPWARYTLFMVPGAVAWAFIYATIGLAAFLAIVGTTSGRWWGLTAVALAAVVLLARRRRTTTSVPGDRADAEP